MAYEVAVFDFDQTLADTSKYQPLREAHQWSAYFSVVSQAPPISLSRGGTSIDLLRETVSAGVRAIVVSRSPDTAVRAWLASNAPGIPILHVHGSIGRNWDKLHQIAAALKGKRVVFVDDQPDALDVARRLEWATLSASSLARMSRPPDGWILSPRSVIDPDERGVLVGDLGEPGHKGVIVESDNGRLRVYGGRYVRRGRSTLSRAILEMKETGEWPQNLHTVARDVLCAAITLVLKLTRIEREDIVLCGIPPKPGQTDRFRAVLTAVARLWKRITVDPDALSLVRQIGSQHGRGLPARRENVRGAFGARSVQGKGVVVIDDIATSGSTLDAAETALRSAGATAVIGAALAHTVSDGPFNQVGVFVETARLSQIEKASSTRRDGSATTEPDDQNTGSQGTPGTNRLHPCARLGCSQPARTGRFCSIHRHLDV